MLATPPLPAAPSFGGSSAPRRCGDARRSARLRGRPKCGRRARPGGSRAPRGAAARPPGRAARGRRARGSRPRRAMPRRPRHWCGCRARRAAPHSAGLAWRGPSRPGRDRRASFGGERQRQICRGHGPDVDVQVDAVEERARQPALVVFRAARRPAAGEFGKMATTARVHRRDQLKARRIGDVPLSAGDADAAGLERLAQRLERSAIEFRNYVGVSPKMPNRAPDSTPPVPAIPPKSCGSIPWPILWKSQILHGISAD
jgi:hypothetical protein